MPRQGPKETGSGGKWDLCDKTGIIGDLCAWWVWIDSISRISDVGEDSARRQEIWSVASLTRFSLATMWQERLVNHGSFYILTLPHTPAERMEPVHVFIDTCLAPAKLRRSFREDLWLCVLSQA
jgi:hypothetical protein